MLRVKRVRGRAGGWSILTGANFILVPFPNLWIGHRRCWSLREPAGSHRTPHQTRAPHPILTSSPTSPSSSSSRDGRVTPLPVIFKPIQQNTISQYLHTGREDMKGGGSCCTTHSTPIPCGSQNHGGGCGGVDPRPRCSST